MAHRLQGFTKETKTSPQPIQLSVKNHQVTVRHDEWCAASNQVDVILVRGRDHLRRNVLTGTAAASVLDLGEGHCPVCIQKKGSDRFSVVIINLHVTRFLRTVVFSVAVCLGFGCTEQHLAESSRGRATALDRRHNAPYSSGEPPLAPKI
jgi:hypothetical protein